MKYLIPVACATLLAAVTQTVTVAGAHENHAHDFKAQIGARQGQFRLIAYNLGLLGSMAKGDIDYESEVAGTAASNLVAVSSLAQNHWPAGSDAMAIDGTRAEPMIWDDFDDFASKWQDFGAKAAELQAVAADGQAGLGPAIGALGETCKACHESYRTPDE